MPDTTMRRQTGPGGAAPRPGPPRNWSKEPHHRRRRALALLLFGIAAIIVLIAITTGGGGATPQPAALGAGSFFQRLQTLAGGGSGSFAGNELAAENGAIDRTLAYTPLVQIAGSQHREVALTFDDGPGPYTPQVLSVLQRDNAPATFFQVGNLQRYFHASTSQIVAMGDPIGDHTFGHAPMSHLPYAEQQKQLLDQVTAIRQYGAPFPRLFRPPYGYWNKETLSLLHKYRMLMILWTIDTEDFKLPGSAAIAQRVLAGARPGAIFLMHDAGGNRAETAAALPEIIHGLRAKGYKLVTVPKLLLDNPPPRNQQVPASGSGG
ncbi:MAG TPA: polysaccharide deacetylase family protein [Solirubrobacteraceae bacterium]|nr:polysaccharide deacetylase family protein [Solirubrobacteraceae bacterium]